MAARQRKDGRWIVTYRQTGVKNPITEYFGRGPAAQQAAEERDLEVKLLKKRGVLAPRSEATYLDTLSQAYLTDAKLRNTSSQFQREYSKMLNEKLLPALSYRPVDELTYAEVTSLVVDLWGHRKPATVQKYLTIIKAIFAFGVRHGMTKTNPLALWKRQKPAKLDFKLTVEDLQKIMDAAPPYLAWALEVEWELGTRPGVSELYRLRWDDVDFEAGTIRVRGTKTAGSDRIMPLTPGFVARLREQQPQARTEYLVEYKGQPVADLRVSLKKYAALAGLTYTVRTYDVRHLYASVMLSEGGDLAAVSKLLGHTNIATTSETYYHVMRGEKARATALRPVIRKAIKQPPVVQNEGQIEKDKAQSIETIED